MMMHGFVHRPLAHELVQTPFFSVAWGASARGTSCQENVAKRPPDPFFVLVQNLGLDGWQIDQVLTRSATQTQILYQKKRPPDPTR